MTAEHPAEVTRKAIAMLTAFMENDERGFEVTNQLMADYFAEAPSFDAAAADMAAGMQNVAVHLLVLIEKELGWPPARTLQHLASKYA